MTTDYRTKIIFGDIDAVPYIQFIIDLNAQPGREYFIQDGKNAKEKYLYVSAKLLKNNILKYLVMEDEYQPFALCLADGVRVILTTFITLTTKGNLANNKNHNLRSCMILPSMQCIVTDGDGTCRYTLYFRFTFGNDNFDPDYVVKSKHTFLCLCCGSENCGYDYE